MLFEKLQCFVLSKLKTELPAFLSYHKVEHTIQVLEHAKKLAEPEHVSGNDLVLLCTAALLHDSGFLEGYYGHEEISCRIAKTILPGFEYATDEIERICELIMATRIPQEPKDLLAQILCDADLYYLGTDEYATDAENLYQEWFHAALIRTREEWCEAQIKFLQDHHYFTATAKNELSAAHRQNLLALTAHLRKTEYAKEKRIISGL
jgi:HD superfamily phosphodiesterase